MGVRRDKIAKKKRALPGRVDEDALVEGSVAGRRNDLDSLHDFPFARHELDFLGHFQRREISLEVARRGALVGMHCVVVLAPPHNVGRVRKADLERTVGSVAGVAAGVIEVEMGIDDDRDVRRLDAYFLEAILEQSRSVGALILEPVDVLELLVLLVARAGVDEDESGRMLDEKVAHAELDPVPGIRRNALLPQRLRNDAEHRAAVESLTARLDRVNREAANLATLHEGTR